MHLLASMGPPGGGRMVISKRLQSRFNLINMTFPQVDKYALLTNREVKMAGNWPSVCFSRDEEVHEVANEERS